ncbi:YihY/virulence factor BrkB family protein [Salegentibacter salegens]|uniref:Membrane protein n=1 Tax=Salegentibacter salegens TaxID=143223 RepID=A0A1M7IVG8_9FLAO|nr:YihY/virulence factor BrkB family protein [Salegentibacter salegens]PRX49820.1 membrane protein [Salegentibacter salegens]SHM44678.1 membrane protein [Salegentibacter salegens]
MNFFKTTWSLFKQAYISWNRNEPYARSATIAYYALFSLPSLLIIVVTIAGYFFEQKAVQGRLTSEISGFVGQEPADAIENMIASAALATESTWAIIFGIGMLLFGATGVFFQLKMAMNNIWNVAAKQTNFLRILLDRLISFGMVMVIGLLLLLSLVISALIRILKDEIEQYAPNVTEFMVDVANFGISFLVITTLFAAIFKLLPDIKLRWRITYVGAGLTTVLFLVGEALISFYFGKSEPASVYGGASSVVLILLWVYYTCLILFFGAEFTVQYALLKNERVVPNKYGEPAIYQELEKLQQKRTQLEEEKEIIDTLKNNMNWEKNREKDQKTKNKK